MSELMGHFGIDWKLLLAQVVNFFILLILLTKFAYRPVMEILKKRREEIEKGLRFTNEAEEKLRQVDSMREEIMQQTRSEALAVVTRAEDRARLRKEEILKEALKRSEAAIADAKKAIQEEKAKMREEMYKDTKELVRNGIAKVLGRVPPEIRDEGLISQALDELRTLKLK